MAAADAGRDSLAQRYYIQALDLTMRAGNRPHAANVLATMSRMTVQIDENTPAEHNTARHLVSTVRTIIKEEGLPGQWSALWTNLAADDDATAALTRMDDAMVCAGMVHLEGLAASLAQLGVHAVVDPCVVRSHEYYTGIAFEIDILTDQRVFVEVGGGGRYDRLVGHFVTDGHITAVPATGCAFGVERLVDVLDQLELLGDDRSATATVSLGQASADLLVVPGPDASGYVNASRVAAKHRDGGRRVDVYVGDPVKWRHYASARGIAEHELLTQEDLTGEDRQFPTPGNP
ncbi:MAG: ATP phosphoribosyltransferase regulatory subunit [Acidimicrobiia bacterium]